MDLEKVLQNIGFSEKESKIYLALLSLKEALPSTVAKKAGTKRPNTYFILEDLAKNGLVSKVKRGGYYHFQAISPNSLIEDYYKKYDDLKNSLPELVTLHESYVAQPQMSLFEGERGIIRIMDDTLTTSTEILCWADVELAVTSFKEYYPNYLKKRVEKGIFLKGIFCDDKFARDSKKRSEKELREVCLISKKDYPFKNEINIYDDKVAIISHKDKVGVIITNQNIADTQRSIFKFAFKYAKAFSGDSQHDRKTSRPRGRGF